MNKKTDLQISPYFLSVRRGLTLATPFLILGSFALLLNSFPQAEYQVFIKETFLNGAVSLLLVTIYNLSLGSLALVLIITISLAFGQMCSSDDVLFYPVTALCAYLAFCGGLQEQEVYIFGAEWVFSAICITLITCACMKRWSGISKKFERLHTIGADYIFNLAIKNVVPLAAVVLGFGILGIALRALVGDISITNFGSYAFLQIFNKIGNNLTAALLYVLFVHVLWFFGIHGTNALESVAQNFFEEGAVMSQSALADGVLPVEIYSKSFLDTFVFMGGCGAAVCLIIALFLAAKKKHNRNLAKIASPLVLFNINEIVIFGFPVIFNPIMIIPFIVTPLVSLLTSSAAMQVGLVPCVTASVEWTVPPLISGYQATGAISGSLLQLVNILIGTAIYIPFIRISEKRQTSEFQTGISQMEHDICEGAAHGKVPEFMVNTYPLNYAAKTLSMDLKNAMQRNQVELYYQVQVNCDETVSGAEALLRWKHPIKGFIAPPLLIAMAHEGKFLNQLGYHLIEKACSDIEVINKEHPKGVRISVNLSPYQLEDEDFVSQIKCILSRHDLGRSRLVFEITENVLLSHSSLLIQSLEKLRKSGIEISMDDFGMGHGSMVYLQDNPFDEVKLDGSLVKQLLNNDRSKNIVSVIIKMSQDLDFRVVAEFVEDAKQRDLLREMGCNVYQGYYYGKAVPLKEFIEEFLTK